jgi:hypothetical protein
MASREQSSAVDEATRKTRTYARADADRPRNGQRYPFAQGPSIGECLEAYYAEHIHKTDGFNVLRYRDFEPVPGSQ